MEERQQRLARHHRIPEENVLDLKALVREKSASQPTPRRRRISRAVAAHAHGVAGRFVQHVRKLRLVRPRMPRRNEPPAPAPSFSHIPVALRARHRAATTAHPARITESRRPVLTFSVPTWVRRGTIYRQVAVFVVVSLLLVLPLHALVFYQRAQAVRSDVLETSSSAFNALQAGQAAINERDFLRAQQTFGDAVAAFDAAANDLSAFNAVLVRMSQLLPGKGSQLATGTHLVSAGRAAAEAARQLSSAFTVVASSLDEPAAADRGSGPYSLVRAEIVGALASVQTAIDELAAVDADDLPPDARGPIRQVQSAIPALGGQLERLEQALDVLATTFGEGSAKRYLILFQNNTELRPTGGFIGSFALVEIDDGHVTELTVPGGGPYDVNTFLEELVVAPEPLHLVNPHWYLQDANWFPDVPTSAEKILWFYEKSGGPTVDGIMTLTPTVIEQLLALTGPIPMEQYGRTITAENFVRETQEQVEVAYDPTQNTPKQFIADLLPQLLDRLGSEASAHPEDLLRIVAAALTEKHILFYATDPALESRIQSLGWGGELLETAGDYLAVMDTNIGGGKTDGVIESTVRHRATIDADGTVVDRVDITRTHKGDPNDPFTGVRNIDYLRVYVPQGSTLIGATGFETIDPKRFIQPDPAFREDEDLIRIEGNPIIDARTNTRVSQEFGKTVFGNWVGVGPGESVTVALEYRLPFTVLPHGRAGLDGYTLLVQKQPGTNARFLVTDVVFPKVWGVSWVSPEDATIAPAQTHWETDGSVDRIFAVILVRR